MQRNGCANSAGCTAAGPDGLSRTVGGLCVGRQLVSCAMAEACEHVQNVACCLSCLLVALGRGWAHDAIIISITIMDPSRIESVFVGC